MATMAANPAIFLDTNILLRFNIVEMPEHAQVRLAVERLIRDDYQLWISRQIIREFSAVLTRPQTFMNPLATTEVAARVRTLLPLFNVADETASVTEHLMRLMETIPLGGKQIHDANIAATMQTYAIPQLLTLNPVDFVRFSNLITILTLEDLLSK